METPTRIVLEVERDSFGYIKPSLSGPVKIHPAVRWGPIQLAPPSLTLTLTLPLLAPILFISHIANRGAPNSSLHSSQTHTHTHTNSTSSHLKLPPLPFQFECLCVCVSNYLAHLLFVFASSFHCRHFHIEKHPKLPVSYITTQERPLDVLCSVLTVSVYVFICQPL